MQLDILFKAAKIQTFPVNVMLHLADTFHQFHLPIRDADRVIKQVTQEGAGSNVRVLVDGRSQYRAPVPLKILGIIRSSAEEADPNWCAGNNHDSRKCCMFCSMNRSAFASDAG